GMRLVDVAGGTGDVAGGFLRRGGGSAVICDINEEMMRAGIDRDLDRGIVDGAARVCGDAAALPLPTACAEACTIAFGLRNVTRRQEALSEMRRILDIGGNFLCLEFSPAVLPQLKPIYDAYSFRVLPWLGARVASDAASYEYLAESIRRFPEPEILADEMKTAGFGNVTCTALSGGIVWLHSGWRV
ncbi:MAG: ubiquinone/menaquinone biosynthesis methyltransferase, partial [Alphaproteobacteria bacterium]